MTIGYNKPLFILPFDHRASFVKGYLGGEKSVLTDEETKTIKDAKQIIYEGFQKAVVDGVPKEYAAILVDEQFGSDILQDAKEKGFATLLPVEKSGQEVFDFDHGTAFTETIEHFKPSFVKVLVRYNPDDTPEIKKTQQERLQMLSDYCHKHGHTLLFELLVPASSQQLASVNSDKHVYDKMLRAGLTSITIKELQDNGVEPDVWKLEGLSSKEDYELVIETIRRGGRDDVGYVVLGRGESWEHVEEWLRIGGGVSGVTGFAVGRTIFWQPLMDFRDKKSTREQAAFTIAHNFLSFYKLFVASQTH